MKRRTDLYSFIVTLAILTLFLVLTIGLEYPKAQHVPYIAVSIGLVATIAGLLKTIVLKGEYVEGVRFDERPGDGEGLQGWRRYMVIAWLVIVYVAFAVFGIIIGTGLFVGSFMKFYGARWWVALTFTIIAPAFIYLLFKVALGLYLYNGVFLPS